MIPLMASPTDLTMFETPSITALIPLPNPSANLPAPSNALPIPSRADLTAEPTDSTIEATPCRADWIP